MADNRPNVAVIIPTYNRAHMVGAAIESLLAQTRRPTQIIVVDDGSEDDTQDVLKQYAGITNIRQTNRGLAAARNAGLLSVQSDYVAFLDSDDALPPDSLEIRAQALDQEPNVDVVYGDAWLIDPLRNRRVRFSAYRGAVPPTGSLYPYLVLDNVAPAHCFLFRSRCLYQLNHWFDETLDTLEDHDFWLRMSSFAQFRYVDVPVADYIVHPDMMTRRVPDRMRNGLLVVQIRATQMPEFATLSPMHRAAVYSSIGSTCLALGRMVEARDWLRKSFHTAPAFSSASQYMLSFLGKCGTRPILELRRKLRALLHPETRMFYG